MPSITFSEKDLFKLVGKTIPEAELTTILESAKAEIESRENGKITLKFNDTNLPYLWSIEGVARFIRLFKNLQSSPAKLKLEEKSYEIKTEPSVATVRPIIGGFVAEGSKITEELLEQLIQLQEKLADSYGKNREKISIGLYPASKIKFPLTYKAVDPSFKFTPLEFSHDMTLASILKEHPKGMKYAKILENKKQYPILVDATNSVLSFPPIINSNNLGKLTIGDNVIFCDVTGHELKDVNLALVICAYALSERGFKIYPTKVNNHVLPDLRFKKVMFDKKLVKEVLGLDLGDKEIKELLHKFGYEVEGNVVEIPPYRQDIMHNVDIVEDIGIAYGYDKLIPIPLTSYTVGSTFPIINFVDKFRTIVAGCGFQEVYSAILSNKEALYEKMNLQESSTVELLDFISNNYSVIRSSLLPMLMDVLQKSKHNTYPQMLFEQGVISVLLNNEAVDKEHCALISVHNNASFTEIKSVMGAIARNLGIELEYNIAENDSYIKGRCASISYRKKQFGVMGELSPAVLGNWKLELPAAAAELDLSALFEELSKR